MYPFRRVGLEIMRAGRLPAMDFGAEHRTPVRVMPWDIDIFHELNNGRTLTLLDIARLGYFRRLRVLSVARHEGWAPTVAGCSVRYRRRVRMFQRVIVTTELAGRDRRFFYMHHVIWRPGPGDGLGEPTASALMRLVMADADGIVPTDRVMAALGARADWNPPLPDWVAAWAEAEAMRPWPPILPSAASDH